MVVLYITEKAILKLTNCVDAEEFQQLYREERLRLPFFASIKALRRPSKSDFAGLANPVAHFLRPPQNDNNFDCYIVDAAEQTMQEIPSAVCLKLLPMLNCSVDSILPATLQMIRKSEHYSMAVQYTTQDVPAELAKVASKTKAGITLLRPCSRVAVLVISNQRSQLSPSGTGHKLVTANVVDFLHTDSAEQPGPRQKYEITTFCTLDNVTDYKLDPPKQAAFKQQAALISVTGVVTADTDSTERPIKGFIADDVQLLNPEQAESLKTMLKKWMYFAALGGQMSRKRESEPWSPEDNPAQAGPCRRLGRAPTGPELPDYSDSVATAGA